MFMVRGSLFRLTIKERTFFLFFSWLRSVIKLNLSRKNTMIKATANNNLLHNQQAAILGHSLIKVRKVLVPSQTRNQFNLILKIISINLE